MKRPALIALIGMLLIAQAPHASAIRPQESWLKLTLFAPCSIVFEYQYTHNLTIGDVSTYGPSMYEISHTPTQCKFEAEDIDQYLFTLTLVYAVILNQQMRITIFQGEQPPSYIELPFAGSQLNIYVDVTVLPEPKFPSTQEITDSVLKQIGVKLDFYHDDNIQQFNLLKNGLNSNTYVLAGFAIALAILGGTLFTVMKQRRRP